MKLRTVFVALALLALAACEPNLSGLQKGESGKVARANAGAAIELAGGKGVFLAEIGAPRRDEAYANNARADLEALAVGRQALLAYGGERVWTPRPRDAQAAAPAATAPAQAPRTFAIAHVFVQSEGGRWIWLQHALVTQGAAWVRPRAKNHARIAQLFEAEARARAAHRGLWAERDYRVLSVADAAALARTSAQSCMRGAAPYRLVEGDVVRVEPGTDRAALIMQNGDVPFALVLFGDALTSWDGPPLESFAHKHIIARGPLGLFQNAPQLCLEQASGLQIARAGTT